MTTYPEAASEATIPDESDEIAMHEIASRQSELFTGHPASAIGL
jgi:hypothetical protein